MTSALLATLLLASTPARYLSAEVSDTGGGWGELTRPNRRCATPLLIYNTESDTFDIEVRDNDFGTPKHGLIHTIDGTVPEGYRIK
jgi:hypothetical protein